MPTLSKGSRLWVHTPLFVEDLEVHVFVGRPGCEAQQAGAAVLVRIGVALQQVLRRLSPSHVLSGQVIRVTWMLIAPCWTAMLIRI